GRNVLVDMLARVRPTEGTMTQSKPPGEAPSADATAKVAAIPDEDLARATEPSVSNMARTALGIGQVPAVAPSPGAVPRPAQKQGWPAANLGQTARMAPAGQASSSLGQTAPMAQASPLATTEVSVPGFFAAALVPPSGNGPPPAAPMRVPLSSPPAAMHAPP